MRKVWIIILLLVVVLFGLVAGIRVLYPVSTDSSTELRLMEENSILQWKIDVLLNEVANSNQMVDYYKFEADRWHYYYIERNERLVEVWQENKELMKGIKILESKLIFSTSEPVN